jgi:hypothetical protein
MYPILGIARWVMIPRLHKKNFTKLPALARKVPSKSTAWEKLAYLLPRQSILAETKMVCARAPQKIKRNVKGEVSTDSKKFPSSSSSR